MLLRQRDDLIVERALGVAEFLDRADFLAERLDVGGELGGIEGHDGFLLKGGAILFAAVVHPRLAHVSETSTIALNGATS